MQLVIIGAGGHGRVVLDILRLAGQHDIVGFVDADSARAGTTVAGLPVLGAVNILAKLRKQGVSGAIVAIGDNRVRLGYAQLVIESGLELVNAIHPASTIAPTAKLGRNVVVAAGAIINPDAGISDSAIINSGAIVEHECSIGPGAHICPGALLAGRVHVEAGAFVGLGARVIPCLMIGRYAVVGAGAVVTRDVPEGATVVGVPARVVRIAPPEAIVA